MRFVSLRMLVALVVLPPLFYVAALQGLESFLVGHYQDQIQSRIPGDTQALLMGRVRLDDQIAAAVESVLAKTAWRHRGVMLSVSVRTLAGRRLYPPVYRETGVPEPAIDPLHAASENFALLNEGLDVAVTVTIRHNSLVSNGVLALAILPSLIGLFEVYRRGRRALAREEALRRRDEEEIRARERERQAALAALEVQRENLTTEIAAIQSKLKEAHVQAARTEADLFDEMEALEAKLQQNRQQQDQQQVRIQELEDHLSRLAGEREALAIPLAKAANGLRKRMETLYKKASFTDRALSGLADLPEAMQIKAEEIIHQLNAQTEDVSIKRKLFRGKGKETVFEIVFARKGRLYFRRTRDRKTDVLAIGTKNTQEKDLTYLDGIL